MTQAQTKKTEADFITQSIDQWDDEGGSIQRACEPFQAVSKYRPMELLAGGLDGSDIITFAEEEQILECLGAAVTIKWETLPRKIQRELFDHATAIADSMDAVQFKGRIARFLHENKGSTFASVWVEAS